MVKTVINSVIRPCKPVEPHKKLYITSLGPKTGCVLRPLGSPTGPSNVQYACVTGARYGAAGTCGTGAVVRGMVPGGYTGRAIPVPSTEDVHRQAEARYSEAGPGSPSMGLEWVVSSCSAPYVRPYRPPTPLRSGARSAVCRPSSSKPRLLALIGEI